MTQLEPGLVESNYLSKSDGSYLRSDTQVKSVGFQSVGFQSVGFQSVGFQSVGFETLPIQKLFQHIIHDVFWRKGFKAQVNLNYYVPQEANFWCRRRAEGQSHKARYSSRGFSAISGGGFFPLDSGVGSLVPCLKVWFNTCAKLIQFLFCFDL